jgi:hypothetical protein
MEATEVLSKQKNTIFNVVILIVCILAAAKIYEFQMKEVSQLKSNKEVELKKNEIMANIGRTGKKIDSYKGLLTLKDTSEIISTLSTLAKDSQVKIVSLRPNSPVRYSEYSKIPFALTLSAANIRALGNFISRLESYQDVYAVDSIAVRMQNEPVQLVVDLTVSSIGH